MPDKCEMHLGQNTTEETAFQGQLSLRHLRVESLAGHVDQSCMQHQGFARAACISLHLNNEKQQLQAVS